MFTIRKQFDFSAAHQLDMLPPEHPCSKLHGHNYIVILELRSETLNEVGFVDDYRSLAPFKKYIDDVYDHKNLNDFVDQPTAELLAKRLFNIWKSDFKHLWAVEVCETPKTIARYSPYEIDWRMVLNSKDLDVILKRLEDE